MTKIDEFKDFVKKNPRLVKYVKNGDSNWQKFYEIYDLYGEDKEAWKEYLNVETATATATAATTAIGVGEIFNWLKNINLDSFQSGISNLQRVIGLVQDLSSKDDTKPNKEYKPRPMYKHFED